SNMLTKRVLGVQKQVEGHHFDTRKHILEYDDVINKHREIIYSKRNQLLETQNTGETLHEDIQDMIENQSDALIKSGMVKNTQEALEKIEILKKNALSEEKFYELERRIMLQSIDELWMRHIDAMSHLREEVAFEGYAQRNPLVVYKEKAYQKFQDFMNELEYKVIHALFSVQKIEQVENVQVATRDMQENRDEVASGLENFSDQKQAPKQSGTPSNGNPLFMNPKSAPQQAPSKKKIRI
ncbi:hypothetical protein MK079_03520, partial [Candidatus Gracilibacteria bacterium]|nr:hypothetical protein [Candidatus Gracilibacteria bacterium]